VVTRKAKTTICCGCAEKQQQYVEKSEDRCGPGNFDRDKIARQKEKNSNQGAATPKSLNFFRFCSVERRFLRFDKRVPPLLPKSGGDRPACLTVADCGQIAGFGEM